MRCINDIHTVLFRIPSFGAPVQNIYKLVIEDQNPISLQTSMVSDLLSDWLNNPHVIFISG